MMRWDKHRTVATRNRARLRTYLRGVKSEMGERWKGFGRAASVSGGGRLAPSLGVACWAARTRSLK